MARAPGLGAKGVPAQILTAGHQAAGSLMAPVPRTNR